MNHVVVTWNSQGFRLDDLEFANWIAYLVKECPGFYFTICIQESGNLVTNASQIAPYFMTGNWRECNKPVTIKGSTIPHHAIYYAPASPQNQMGFQAYQYLWQTTSSGNTRCSLAIFSNLPNISFEYASGSIDLSTKTVYRPIISAQSSSTCVYNLHAAATSADSETEGRLQYLFHNMEDTWAISGAGGPSQVVVGDFNLDVYALLGHNSWDAMTLRNSMGGFTVNPPASPTQGTWTNKGTPIEMRNLTNNYDYMVGKDVQLVHPSLVPSIGMSDHVPVAYFLG